MHGLTPSGSSGFADNTTFHTDGVNAVSSMQAIVFLAGKFLTWTGQMVNMLKSKISAIDFAYGQIVATDNIRLSGVAFRCNFFFAKVLETFQFFLKKIEIASNNLDFGNNLERFSFQLLLTIV